MHRLVANCARVVCLSLKQREHSDERPIPLISELARGGSYYIQNNVTKKQQSLRTKDRTTAERLLCPELENL